MTSELSGEDEKQVFHSKSHDYEEVERVGAGSSGSVVYKVVERSSSLVRSLKTVLNTSRDRSYEKEADLILKLDSGHLVKYHEIFFSNPFTCIVTDFYEANLRNVLKVYKEKNQSLEGYIILKWSGELLRGLKMLHSIPIVHKSLKPENLFLFNNTLKIGDIGVAITTETFKLAKQSPECLQYMPSEIIRAEGDLNDPMSIRNLFTTQTDIWSFGCIFYEMITNEKLFEDTTVRQLEESINGFDGTNIPLGFNNNLYELVLKNTLKKEPEERAEIYYLISEIDRVFSLINHYELMMVEANKPELINLIASIAFLNTDPVEKELVSIIYQELTSSKQQVELDEHLKFLDIQSVIKLEDEGARFRVKSRIQHHLQLYIQFKNVNELFVLSRVAGAVNRYCGVIKKNKGSPATRAQTLDQDELGRLITHLIILSIKYNRLSRFTAELYENVAFYYSFYLSEHKQAIELYLKALAIRERVYAKKKKEGPHPSIALILNKIGMCYVSLGEYKQALGYYEKSYEIRKELYVNDTNNRLLASSLTNLGNCLSNLGDLKKALKCHLESLAIREKIYGPDQNHPNLAVSLNNVGFCYDSLSDFSNALHYYQKALEMRQALQKEDPSYEDSVAASYNNLGLCYANAGDFQRALDYHQQSLDIKQRLYGDSDNHSSIITSLNHMALCYAGLGDYGKAMEYHNRALTALREQKDKKHDLPFVAATLNNIANSYSNLDQHEQALDLNMEAYEIMKAVYEDDHHHPNVAVSLTNLGNSYSNLGEHEKALRCHMRSLETLKRVYANNESTEEHPLLSVCLNNIGHCYLQMNEHEKAYEYYRKSLEIRRSFFPDDHPGIASCLSNIANCHYNMGQLEKSIEENNEALSMYQRTYSGDHSNIARTMRSMSSCYAKLDDLEKSADYGMKSYEMLKRLYTNEKRSGSRRMSSVDKKRLSSISDELVRIYERLGENDRVELLKNDLDWD